MPASETLEIVIKARDEARRNLGRLEKSINKLDKTTKRTSRSLALMRGTLRTIHSTVFSLKGAFAALGIGLVVRSFIQAADTAEQYRTRLNVLLGSVKEGNRLFENMAEFASTVSFEFEEIQGAATNLAGVMRGGTDEITKFMPLIADLAAATGMSIQDTTSQVIRMYSAGAAAADMFREKGVLAMLGFQAGVSVSAEETRRRLMEAWEDPASQFRGAATALANTWSGMLSMMSDAWFQFRNLVMEGGVFDFIKAALAEFLEFIKQLKEEGRLQEWAQEMAIFVLEAISKMAQGVGILIDAWWGLRMLWDVIKIAFGHFALFVNKGILLMGEALLWVSEQFNEFIQNLGNMGQVLKFVPGFRMIGQAMVLASDSAKDMTKSWEESTKQAAFAVKFWNEIVEESSKELDVLAGQESAYKRVNAILDRITKRAAEFRQAAIDAADAPARVKPDLIPEAALEAQLRSAVTRGAQIAQTALQQLEITYDQGVVKFQEYWDKREQITNERFQKEIDVLNQLADRETDPTKKLKALDLAFAKEEEFFRATEALAQERLTAEAESERQILETKQLFSEQKLRLAETEAERTALMREQELIDLELRQEQEMQMLIDFHASQEEQTELHRLHELERDKVTNDQRVEASALSNQQINDSLGTLEGAFSDLYQVAGQESKEFFVGQKALAIAQTTISAVAAAQKAFEGVAGLGPVGLALATVQAAIALASGMARVALIRSQTLALGGKVKGYSPTSKSDNIPIQATAGEFMQPVRSVRHYGMGVMEAIRRRAIPKEILQDFALPSIRPNHKVAFQSGGAVAAGATTSGAGSAREEQPININNIIDPQMMDQYVATKPGQRNVMNVLSQNQFQLRQIVLGEQ